jgi:hypothetical protein
MFLEAEPAGLAALGAAATNHNGAARCA